jgi:cyclopropane fatty-acyl-phospholipid synthase-like methyltransferase
MQQSRCDTEVFFGKILFAWMAPKTIADARWTADILEVQPKDKIIEIGFGNGGTLNYYCKKQSEVLRRDLSL